MYYTLINMVKQKLITDIFYLTFIQVPFKIVSNMMNSFYSNYTEMLIIDANRLVILNIL